MIGLEPNLFAMLFGVQFCRFACVMGGVMHMSLSEAFVTDTAGIPAGEQS
jgi:hypothetical protein